MTSSVLATLETYYDTAPRATASAEEVGPFTLFVKDDPSGWDYYARPRLGVTEDIGVDDVRRAQERMLERSVPVSFEWVHDTTPSLLDAAKGVGLHVDECPLLVLPADAPPARRTSNADVRLLDVDEPRLDEVVGAVNAGFDGSDDVQVPGAERQRRLMQEGLLAMAGAFDERNAVGGGSHGPRGSTTELTGIAVLPRARRRGVGADLTAALVDDARARGVDTVFLSAQDDAVARVYERVGFVRVGTACMAEVPNR